MGLPDDFSISEDMRKWGNETVPAVDLDFETQNFQDHYRANGKAFKDWTAAWRTWMRNSQKWNGNGRKPAVAGESWQQRQDREEKEKLERASANYEKRKADLAAKGML